MLRARLLVIKAHPNLAHPDRERILVTSFLIGLYDRQLAASLAVAKFRMQRTLSGLLSRERQCVTISDLDAPISICCTKEH